MSFISSIKNFFTLDKHYFVSSKLITVIKHTKINGTMVITSYDPYKRPIKTITKTPFQSANIVGHNTEIINHRQNNRVTLIQKYTKTAAFDMFNALDKTKIADKNQKIMFFMKSTKENGLSKGIYFYRAEYPKFINQLKVIYDNLGKAVCAEHIKTMFK